MDDFNQAEYYEATRSSNISYQDGMKMIELLAPQRGDSVLDVGCGTGYLTKMLADLVGPEGKVVGVDPDVERLKIARDKYPARNLEYLEGTAENIPGSNSTYDIIFSNYVLHRCEDKKSLLKDFAAKLKPGGKFGFVAVSDHVGGLGPDEMFSQKFLSAISKSFHLFDNSFFNLVESTKCFKVTYFRKHIHENKLQGGVSELVKQYSTHIPGGIDESDFNIEAMRHHFGEGEVARPLELFNVVLVNSL